MAGKNPRLDNADASDFFELLAEFGSEPTPMTRYQELTRKFRMGTSNPDSFVGVSYVMTKLAGEAGEVAEQWGKAIRDDDLADRIADAQNDEVGENVFMTAPASQFMDTKRLESMTDEAGDLLYYLSETLNFLGLTFEELAARNVNKLQGRLARGTLGGEGSHR